MTKPRYQRSDIRRAGSVLFEIAMLGFIVCAMAIICVNIGVLVFAAWLNDAACRDACRAGAQQSNETDAKAAAVLAAKNFATSNGGVVGNPIVLLDDASFEYERFPDAAGKPQMDQGPFIRVTTSLNAVMPAKVILTGVGFTDVLVFRQTHTFPLLEPGTTDDGSDIDPSLAQQDEDDLAAAAAAAEAAGADESIPVPPAP